MGKIPTLKAREVVALLESFGFQEVPAKKGLISSSATRMVAALQSHFIKEETFPRSSSGKLQMTSASLLTNCLDGIDSSWQLSERIKTMRSEIEIAYDGMNVLIERLGMVEAEKFISMIHRESFDYTEWRKKLWPDKTVRELSKDAMEYRKKMDNK